MRGIIHYDLFQDIKTITAKLYCQQLQRLMQGNAQFNKSQRGYPLNQEQIQALGWEKLLHPPYSADIAPFDFHLFRSLDNHFADKKNWLLENNLNINKMVSLTQKNKEYYEQGIQKLINRRAEIVHGILYKNKI